MIDIKSERVNRGLSVKAAAEAIGVAPVVLRRAEDGTAVPRPHNAAKIARFYGVQATDLWPLDDDLAVAA